MINHIATKFGKTYNQSKTYTASKDSLQKELFEAFDQLLQEKTLGQIVVDTPIELQEELPEWITINHPGYRLVEIRGSKVVLEEDPQFLSYTYINPDDGYVYGRDRTTGTPELDEMALRKSDPELWERITKWPQEFVEIAEIFIQKLRPVWQPYDRDEEFINTVFTDFGIERVLIPLNEIHENDLVRIQEYTRPGKIGTRLRPPRKATEEELQQND